MQKHTTLCKAMQNDATLCLIIIIIIIVIIIIIIIIIVTYATAQEKKFFEINPQEWGGRF